MANSMRSLSLKSQYYLGAALILLFCCVFVSWYQYHSLKEQAMESVYQKTEIYLTAAASIRSYVKDVLRPKVGELVSSDQFILEAMSTSYISRQIMHNLRQSFPEFIYRRVASDPRNPLNEADEFELKMFDWFEHRPNADQWSGLIKKEGYSYYVRMMPIYAEAQCLACHGDPKDAPEELKAIYGAEHSYGYEENSLVGLDTIYIPMNRLNLKIKDDTLWVFLIGFASLFSLFILFALLFNRTVVQQLKKVLLSFKRIYSEDPIDESLLDHSNDEVEQIKSAFEMVADQLQIVHDNLKASEAKYRSLFVTSPDAVFVSDASGKLTDLNRIGSSLFEISHLDEFLRTANFHDLFYCSEEADRIIEKIHDQGYIVNAEVILKTRSGRRIEGAISASRIMDETHDFNMIEGVIRDISEQKKLSKHLAQTERLASVGQLAAGVAHEINNPLGVILCYGDLVEKSLEINDQIKDDIGVIKKHAGDCKVIVESLLNFARVSEPTMVQADIHDSLKEILAVLQNQMKKQNIILEEHYDPTIGNITFDQHKIRQVFMNLLLNGMQAMPEGGLLTLSSRKDAEGNFIVISIKDSGMGISSDQQDKIFEPFYTTKDTGKGTGLGLSVSYGIVQQHNGEISVESSEGNGATFLVRLPIAPD